MSLTILPNSPAKGRFLSLMLLACGAGICLSTGCTVSTSSTNAKEPSQAGTITFTRTPSPAEADMIAQNGLSQVALPVTISGSATNGVDYVISGLGGEGMPADNLVFPRNTYSVTLTITPLNDAIVEGDETVTISVPAYEYQGQVWMTAASGTLTISDDDTALPPNPKPDPNQNRGGLTLVGGFELPDVGSGFAYGSDASGLTSKGYWFFSGSAGVTGNNSGFTSGNPNAPEGKQVGFIQAGGSAAKPVQLSAGTTALTVWAAQRGNYNANPQTIRVLVDGVSVGEFTPNGKVYSPQYTAQFTVSYTGLHVVSFVGLSSGDSTALIDGVAIATVATSNG